MTTKKCPHCGADIVEGAIRCPVCKEWVDNLSAIQEETTPPKFLPALLFAWFLGAFGIHRFYTGHLISGLVQLLTFGGCGIWSFVDFIMICFNKFKDGQGGLLLDYDKNIGITVFVIALIPLFLIFMLIIIVWLMVVLSGS